MDPTTEEREAFEEWLSWVRDAWKIAYHDRRNELVGKRVSRFDTRGLHPYSEAWGHIFAAEENLDRVGVRLDPDWLISPAQLRAAAEEQALEEFGREWAERWGYVPADRKE